MSGGATAGPPADDTPSRVTPPTSGGSTCPGSRGSGGPVASLVVVVTTSAATARSGATLPVRTEIVVLSDGPRVIARAETSALEVLRDGVVVARSVGSPGPDVPTPVMRGRTIPAQTVPTQVALVGCDGTPLPPGGYRLRALVGYGYDPLNSAQGGGAGSFLLASEPVDLTVT